MFGRTLVAVSAIVLGASIALSEHLPVQLAQHAAPSQSVPDTSQESEHDKHQRAGGGGSPMLKQPGQTDAPTPMQGMGQGGAGGMMKDMHMHQSATPVPPPSAAPPPQQPGGPCAAGTSIQMDAQGRHFCK